MTSNREYLTTLSVHPASGATVSTDYFLLNNNVYALYIHLRQDQEGTLSIIYSMDGVSASETITQSVSDFVFNERVNIKGHYVKFQFENTSATDATFFKLDVYKLIDIKSIDEVIIDDSIPVAVSFQTLNIGSANNMANDIELSAGSNTAIVNIEDINMGSVLYKDSNISVASSTLDIEGGITNTDFYKLGELYVLVNGSQRDASNTGLYLNGIKYLRVKNGTTDDLSNVYISVVGTA